MADEVDADVEVQVLGQQVLEFAAFDDAQPVVAGREGFGFPLTQAVATSTPAVARFSSNPEPIASALAPREESMKGTSRSDGSPEPTACYLRPVVGSCPRHAQSSDSACGSWRAVWLCAHMYIAKAGRSAVGDVSAAAIGPPPGRRTNGGAPWKLSYRSGAGKHATNAVATPGDLDPRFRRTRGSGDTGRMRRVAETNERKPAKVLSGPVLELRQAGNLRRWLADDLPRV